MPIGKTLLAKLVKARASISASWMGRRQGCFMREMNFSDAAVHFKNRNKLHAYMHHHFNHLCPSSVRQHRVYFQRNMRGFGEDAFHAMWCLLFREFKPKNCLEIGVYRGQVISLWALLSELMEIDSSIYGISPFTAAGDGVSSYIDALDYLQDTLNNHRHFNLRQPSLVKAFSTDEAAAAVIGSRKWDLIYIDGSHDYEVALYDYEMCHRNLAIGGILVMDDSSLYTDFRPPRFSFAGHPGPSKVVADRIMKEMDFLGAVGHNNVFAKSRTESFRKK